MDNKSNPENSKPDIREALEKLSVGYVEAKNNSLGDSEILEFDFSNISSEEGLIFEDETEIVSADSDSNEHQEEKGADFPSSAADSSSNIAASDVNKDEACVNSSQNEAANVVQDEFSLPDEFTINEKFNTPEQPIEKTTIKTTYVPRFTEVSDTYRMIDDPRPRPQASSIAPKLSEAAESSDTDPTAEMESAQYDAVKVSASSDVKLEDFSESINVYKFSDEKTEDVPRAESKPFSLKSEETAEESVAEICDEPQETPAEIPDVQKEPSVIESKLHERRGNIEIPDPKAEVNIVDYEPEIQRGIEKYEIPPKDLTPAPLMPKDGKKERLGEYTAFYQRDGFKDKFLDSILSVKIRLFSLAFIALILLVYENLYIFGVDVAAILNIAGARGALSLIDLHLSFCAFALAFPEILSAIKLLAGKKLTPEFFILPSFIVIIATVIWDYISMDITPALFGFVLSIQALAAIYSSYVRRNADFTAFKAVSQNGDKRVLDVSETKNLPKENIALDGAVDSYKSRTVRLFRTSFISDFFKHTSERRENGFVNTVIISAAFGAALVLSLVSAFLVDGASSAFDSFALLVMSAVPTAAFFIHKLPYARAERLSNENKTVIIGEGALYDFSEVDVITFDDTEIFGEDDVALKRFMSYGDKENTAKAMYQMSALFSVVGGPLDSIFTKSLAGKRPVPATNIIIEDDGIQASVDGKRVYAGTYEYMQRHGMSASRDSASSQSVSADTTKIMYAAEDGVIYAKFYIRYSFSERFTEILPSIRAEGIVPLVYTRDPNISNELLKTLSTGQGVIRVMKKNDIPPVEEKSYTRIGAGIVTFGDKMNAIRAVLLAKKYSSLQDKLSKANLALMGVGALAAILLSLFEITLPSLCIALFQLVCSGSLLIASARVLGSNKKH